MRKKLQISSVLVAAFWALLVIAFAISFVGDWYFDRPWANPYWYLFELIVWGGALGLFAVVVAVACWYELKSEHQNLDRDDSDTCSHE